MQTYMNMLDYTVLGNSVREMLISVVIIAATLLAAIVIDRTLKKRLFAWADKTTTPVDDFFLSRLFPPILYLLVIMGMALAKSNLEFEPTVSLWLDKILLAAGLAVFFLLLMRLARGVVDAAAQAYKIRLTDEAPADLSEQLKTADRVKKQVSEILNMILAVLGLLTILSNLGVDLKAIWASLGIGGIAVVVAVKDPLTNIVGRMYIYGTGIFDEGHFIVFGQWSGSVLRISLFRTYLERFADMTTVSIPNAEFIKGAVQTYYGRTRFMFKWDLRVPYEIPAARLQELLVKLRELVHSRPEVNSDWTWIYVDRLEEDAKIVRVWFQARLADWSASLFYGNQVLHDIQELFESMDVPFALPTQKVRLAGSEEGVDEIPAVLPHAEAEPSSGGDDGGAGNG